MTTDYKNKDRLRFYDRSIVSHMHFIEDRIPKNFEEQFPELTERFYIALQFEDVSSLKAIHNTIAKIADRISEEVES